MKKYVLITGPTSGIGEQLAHKIASQNYDIILVARDAKKMQSLSAKLMKNYGIHVISLQCELDKRQQVNDLLVKLEDLGVHITHAALNAGFGLYGEFAESDIEKELNMIETNVTSVVILTKWLVGHMKEMKGGRIMHVASLLSYLPFPYYSVYSATKAFVLAFSQTIAKELENTPVQVLSVCPGPVDTAFNSERMLTTNAYKANKPMNAEKAAAIISRHFLRGKGNKHIGLNNWFISNLPRITPDGIMMSIKHNLASQRA